MSGKLKTIEEVTTLSAKEATQGEYLACLFLLLADNERYGPLKTQPDNKFLVGKQEYPSNVLTAKRLMTDFFSGDRRREAQASGEQPVECGPLQDKGQEHTLVSHVLLLWREISWGIQEVS